MEEEIKELKRQIEELEKRITVIERLIATYRYAPFPHHIERVIGKRLPAQGEPFIPDVEG